jgi:hypothetical protein
LKELTSSLLTKLFRYKYSILFIRIPEGLAPSFLNKPTLKQDAKTATVQIDIAADPSPSLHWTKDGKELLNVDKILTRFDRKGENKYAISLDIKVNQNFLYEKKPFFLFL